jgi:hypothetical protein
MSSEAERIGWPDNAVVREVRAIRARLWRQGGGTVAGLIRLVRGRARKLASAGRTRLKAEKGG